MLDICGHARRFQLGGPRTGRRVVLERPELHREARTGRRRRRRRVAGVRARGVGIRDGRGCGLRRSRLRRGRSRFRRRLRRRHARRGRGIGFRGRLCGILRRGRRCGRNGRVGCRRFVMRDAGLHVGHIVVARRDRLVRGPVRDVDRDVVGDRLRVRIEHHRQHDHRGDDERDRADEATACALLFWKGRIEEQRVRFRTFGAARAALDAFSGALRAHVPGGPGATAAPRGRVVVFLAERENSHEWLSPKLPVSQCCCDLR
ncbi:putative Nucleoside diphosphate kinase [Burkholderia cepacia]